MAKRMLIDSTHSEETRVVVLSGNRLDEFDFETSIKKQIKGNIYLAKVTRVEPSLQAAFVEYGGNRHGFLAFSEIHSDYYRIPVADRPGEPPPEMHRLLGREASAGSVGPEAASDDETGEDTRSESHLSPRGDEADENEELPEPHPPEPLASTEQRESTLAERIDIPTLREASASDASQGPEQPDHPAASGFEAATPDGEEPPIEPATADSAAAPAPPAAAGSDPEAMELSQVSHPAASESAESAPLPPPPEPVETIGGDEIEEASRQRARRYRPYKIQEVVKRRQIMLVQVTKEERGSKGAALTTYLSLAGRYCVLMPNTDRGGGVSRKITNATDRKRLKELVDDLQVPEGMGVIVRTAGSERSKAEIKRDFEYLLRLWDEIRELTLKSTAPALIYEEGNLIKRSIRDLYARDIDEVIVEGDEGYRNAKTFMRMLMPSHAKRVHHYRDPTIPLFQRFQVETQIDAIHSPVVQLRSGGYIVINQTEALVAIDVNSGRATRERNIEETALKTNCEAAEEIARQLRLRDLAGLIVIDFIDMEEHRNQVTVERRLKEAMKHDRARIQVGRISAFGLLEMSRQRLRPSLVEASTQPCPHCGGTGHIRSTESTALHVLRAIEEEGMRRRSAEISVAVPSSVALYILNQKRAALSEIEHRYHFRVAIVQDDTLIPPNLRLERLRAFTSAELAAMPPPEVQPNGFVDEEDEEQDGEVSAQASEDSGMETEGSEEAATPAHTAEPRRDGEDGHGRRRRRRRRRRGGEHGRDGRPMEEPHPEQWERPQAAEADPGASTELAGDGMDADGDDASAHRPAAEFAHGEAGPPDENGNAERKRRRRGRRGGRRRRRGQGEGGHGETRSFDAGPSGGLFGASRDEPSGDGHGREDRADSPAAEHEGSWEQRPDDAAAVAEPRPPESGAPAEPADAAAASGAHARRTEDAPAGGPDEAEARGDGGAVNVPPAITVTERPPNPKRGWWHRLTQG